MAVMVEDREALRPFLHRDPVRNATVIHRAFHHPKYTFAFADGLPEPKAALALAPSDSADRLHQFALHAVDEAAARAVLSAVPTGTSVFHVADEIAFPAVRARLKVGWWGEAILFRMDRETFVDLQTHEVEPVRPADALKIAKLWAKDWDATEYVRSRIVNAPTAAIYEDDELVAWDMSHHETDDVMVLGFLHVMDGHRGKGYAKSVSCAMVKNAFGKGKVPTCHVFTDNEVSIRLMEAMGFRRVCNQTWGDGVVRR